MRITFQYYSSSQRVPHIPISFSRDVAVLPRPGDHVVHHKEDGSTIFEGKEVTHVYEDREHYQGKDYSAEGVYVTLVVKE